MGCNKNHLNPTRLISALGLFLFLLWFLPTVGQAQDKARSFTLVYSNSINGELDPCPG